MGLRNALSIRPFAREKKKIPLQVSVLILKVEIMKKNIVDSVKRILALVGRNEMLMMGYTIKK